MLCNQTLPRVKAAHKSNIGTTQRQRRALATAQRVSAMADNPKSPTMTDLLRNEQKVEIAPDVHKPKPLAEIVSNAAVELKPKPKRAVLGVRPL
jgi:hypothetical protein